MTDLLPTLTRHDSDLLARFRTLRVSADVADLLEVPPRYLRKVLRTRGDRGRYTTFTVSKRSGGVRQIASPPQALRILQEKLNYILQLVYRPKPSVHGFTIGRSIRSNATRHVGQLWILNIDLENYFPSIHFGRVMGAFMAKPFYLPKYAAIALSQICTPSDGLLPQGAPTSPFISNIVCARLDGQLMALAKRHRLKYSRYCDDISLSTSDPEFPASVAVPVGGWTGADVAIGEALQTVVTSNGFTINAGKTRLQAQSSHQEVTGVVVNEFPNVKRTYVRRIQALLHAWRKYGVESAAKTLVKVVGAEPLSDEGNAALIHAFRSHVRGIVEHVGYIRGRKDPLYCKLRNQLHALDASLIKEAPSPSRYRGRLPTSTPERWLELLQRRRGGVALLEVRSGGETNMGTTFALDADTLVTAGHVLKDSVTMMSPSGHLSLESAYFHLTGRARVDAALVPCTHGLAPIQVDRRLPEAGEAVAVIGYASIPGAHPELGIYPGTVDTVRDNYPRDLKLIYISVPPAGGLSGGPLIDCRGRAVGVVIQSQFERTGPEVPGREFFTVLPIRYALEVSRSGAPTAF